MRTPVDPAAEQELVRRARGGDRRAFGELADAYWGRVLRWLTGLTRQPALAEDLTQEAFLRAWKALGTFQPGLSFRAWLFGIARNALIDAHRAGRPRPGGLPDALPGREPDPAASALEREGQALLADACARLPAHFRSAFLLWSQERLSFAEVAAALGLTEETARWRVFKARLLLVEALGAYLDRKAP